MKKIVGLVAILVVLTGCSSSNKTYTCKLDTETFGSTETVVEVDSDGNIQKIKATGKVKAEDIGLEEEHFAEYQEQMESIYADEENISTSFAWEDGTIIATIETDTTKMSADEMKAAFGSEDGIKYEKYKETAKSQGATCK